MSESTYAAAATILAGLMKDHGGDEGHDESAHDGAHGARMDGGFRRFILAGRAVFTLVSEKSGARFTFRVRTAKEDDDSRHFVEVLTGPNNTDDFTYLGTIFNGARYAHGRKSRIGVDASSAKAFAWAWSFLARDVAPPSCQFWHEGTCGRCNRPLTDPTSIETGLGPVCITKG
jgi:hypothetical protein